MRVIDFMKINYWSCDFADCDDYYDEEDGRVWIYACSHPNNKEKYCHLDNKWCGDKDECTLLEDPKNDKNS